MSTRQEKGMIQRQIEMVDSAEIIHRFAEHDKIVRLISVRATLFASPKAVSLKSIFLNENIGQKPKRVAPTKPKN